MNTYLVPGWTRTHGFFVVMGGFHLYRLPNGACSNPYPPEFALPTDFAIVQPLTQHTHEEEVADHPLDFDDLSIRALAYLAPSENEIKDKGKADILVKFIAIIQTLWFVVQCIARGVRHLPLTEIEVVTIAYATMNLFIYYFWWNKPKDVGCPVRIYKTLKADHVERREKSEHKLGVDWIIWRMAIYVAGVQDAHLRLRGEIQVPMFWSGNPSNTAVMRATVGASIIAIAFGAIHLIAWNSEFPSYAELLLWRISCILMTTLPVILTVHAGGVEMGFGHHIWALIFGSSVKILAPLIAFLYVFARIATVVIALTTLRELPLGAFKTVNWTTFIPHV